MHCFISSPCWHGRIHFFFEKRQESCQIIFIIRREKTNIGTKRKKKHKGPKKIQTLYICSGFTCTSSTATTRRAAKSTLAEKLKTVEANVYAGSEGPTERTTLGGHCLEHAYKQRFPNKFSSDPDVRPGPQNQQDSVLESEPIPCLAWLE